MQYVQERIVSSIFKKRLAYGLLLLYIVMSFISLSVESKVPSYFILCVASLISVISLSERMPTSNLAILVLSFSALLSMALFSNRNYEIFALINNAVFFLFSYLICFLIFKLNLSKKIAIALFIISHGYFLLFSLYRYHIDGGIDENTFNSMFYMSSRNIVSAILLTITIFFFSVFYVKDRKIYTSVLGVDLICSLLLYGRSGILLSFSLFFFGFYIKYFRANTIKSLSFILSFLIALTLVIVINFDYILVLCNDLITKTNLQSGLDTPRLVMWFDYITNFNVNILFRGTAFEFSPLITSFEGNPHNSYIMFQARFGIVGFLFVFVIFSIWVRVFFKNIILGGLLSLVFVRMFLDSYALFSYFDFLWMYMLLFLNKDSSRQKDEKININNYSCL
ncbi:hypothetical protein [Budvicia aquatica]|uniref:hypothetical protein n=1 Tax=Budvicia aquatica TaxID=82979 RepID=UPI0021C44EC9|nr:hypothetical protein [Budvicia aquatica]